MSAGFRPWIVFAVVSALAGPKVLADLSSCAWSPGFSYADLNGTVRALAVFDDGSGPALYAGGDFTAAGQTVATRVARWNGSSWSALGPPGAEGVDHVVVALAVFDDGGGPALYAGGYFSSAGGVAANHVARWNGTRWSALGAGATNGVSGPVAALEVWNDGGGQALLVGGDFATAGGVTVNHLARWDGAAFSALTSVAGPGLEEEVRALAVYGGSLVAAGDFLNAGGVLVRHIASWNGTTWSALPGPTAVGLDSPPWRLRVFDLGGGPELFVTGGFFRPGGLAVSNVARWNGSAWAAMGIVPINAESIDAYDLALFDPGTGPALFVGGSSFLEDEPFKGFVAFWTGSGWSVVAQPEGFFFGAGVRTILAHDDGSGSRLYVGGDLTRVGETTVDHLARFDGSGWSRLSSAASAGLDAEVFDFAVFDGSLYAAGNFIVAGPVVANNIARWTGTTWEALPGPSGEVGTDFEVLALAVFDDGGGHQLYVGGNFSTAGGIAAAGIARWNGTSWSTVPGSTTAVNTISALKVFSDGTGQRLYASGFFSIGGFDRVARWDGSGWNRLTGPSGTGTNDAVHTLAVFNDGAGQALYLGGSFTMAGGLPAERVARWDGAAWLPMPGVGGHPSAGVASLVVFNDGAGRALYAGGFFPTAGTVAANHVARFRGGAWSALSSATGPGLPHTVTSLADFTVGLDSYLVAGGGFSTAGGQTVNKIAAWDGTAWNPLSGPSGTGVSVPGSNVSNPSVGTVFAFDDGSGPALWASGDFHFAGGLPAARVGRYVCAVLFADGFETGDTSRWTSTVP